MPIRSPGEKVIPLYSRVESVIRSKIVSGEFEQGQKLPTEDGFVSHFGVSKITVRNALDPGPRPRRPGNVKLWECPGRAGGLF